MAAVHRAGPSMGLQHELYRRSHRVPPPGEVHPERLLDMLSMECQRRKRQSFMEGDVPREPLDLDAIVDEFKIDDSISACFADIGSKKSLQKNKKSKLHKDDNSTDSVLTSIGANGGGQTRNLPSNITSGSKNSSNEEHRFKLSIPSAMKIRLRRGKKQKNFLNVVEKSPYSPIQEIPEEETSSSPTEEQPIETRQVNKSTNETASLPIEGQPIETRQVNTSTNETVIASISTSPSKDQNGLLSVVHESNQKETVITPSNNIHLGNINTETCSVSSVTENTNISQELTHVNDRIEEFLAYVTNGPTKNIPNDLIGLEEMASWRDEAGNSVLHRCIMAGNTRALTEVTELCPGLVRQRNLSHELPIDLAVQSGQCKCLLALLDMSETREEDVSLWTDDIERLITLSIVGNQAQCLVILLEKYTVKSKRRSFSVDKGGNSPAHIAAKLGRLHCLYVLHNYEFDLSGCNLQGLRPVRMASDNRQQYCFRFLVQMETESKLVEQIVSRACIIDRYEMALMGSRNQLENDIRTIEPKLTELGEGISEDQTQIAQHIQSMLGGLENTPPTRETFLHHIAKLQEINHSLWNSRKADIVNTLLQILRRWLASLIELENVQNMANLQRETKVDTEEKRIIIGSIQSAVEEFILEDCNSKKKSDFWDKDASLASTIASSSCLLPTDKNSLPESNVTGSSGTNNDADNESTTTTTCISSSKETQSFKRFATQKLECQSLTSSSQQTTIPEPMALLFEDSSDSYWSSSHSSMSSCESARKWNKFSCREMKVQPSKMVYGMLIPEVSSCHSSSYSSCPKVRHNLKGSSGVHQKRRASFWDLRDLQKRKCKSARFQIENEDLAPDDLMVHRIQQHLKDKMHVKTDLVETVTMATGEIFTEDLDRAFSTQFTESSSGEVSSCRGKMVQYRSDMTAHVTDPSTKQTISHKRSEKAKSKVSIRSLISKLAKKSKKPMSSGSKSEERAGNVGKLERDLRSYTHSEFTERYKPCFGSNT